MATISYDNYHSTVAGTRYSPFHKHIMHDADVTNGDAYTNTGPVGLVELERTIAKDQEQSPRMCQQQRYAHHWIKERLHMWILRSCLEIITWDVYYAEGFSPCLLHRPDSLMSLKLSKVHPKTLKKLLCDKDGNTDLTFGGKGQVFFSNPPHIKKLSLIISCKCNTFSVWNTAPILNWNVQQV